MLLVVFGAGASHDCLPDGVPFEDWRPPLTKDMFDLSRQHYAKIAWMYKASVGVIDEVSSGLRANADTTLERELAAVTERSKLNSERAIGLLAVQFYLSQLLRECSIGVLAAMGRLTNYTRFVDRLEQWRSDHEEETTYVTFNYDTLLDEALRGWGPLEDMDDYIRPHRAYFKVHGSVDWAQLAGDSGGDTLGDYQRMIWAAPRLRRIDSWSIRDNPTTVFDGTYSWAPAIAIPVEDKDELVLPNDHKAALEERLKRVSRVMSFGWKARESEFMRLLRTVPTGVPVDVLTASSAGVNEAAEHLREAGLDGPTVKTASGFEAFVNGIGFTQLLERMSAEEADSSRPRRRVAQTTRQMSRG